MTLSDKSYPWMVSRSRSRDSSDHASPTGISNNAPTIPSTAGICLMCARETGSRSPNQRNVITCEPFAARASSCDAQTSAFQKLLDFFTRYEAEIPRDAMLERGGRRRESKRIFPAALIQPRCDESAAERVTGANPIDHLDLVARRMIRFALGDQHRAPSVEQHARIFAECDCRRTQIEAVDQLSCDISVRFCVDFVVSLMIAPTDAEHHARVLLGRDQDVDKAHQWFLDGPRGFRLPELAPIVQIVTDG